MSDPNFDTLASRIRSEANISDRPGQHDRLNAIADEVERLRSGAKTLGRVIERQGRMALDATGMYHVIGNDGDGDWAVVWENLYDLRPRAERAEAALERLRREVAALADWLCAFDVVDLPVPDSVDVPDDYELGINDAGDRLRALIGGGR